MGGSNTWDYSDPLARYSGETVRQNEALQDYIDLGGGRSLTELLRRYRERTSADPIPPTRSLQTLKNWSYANCWQARVARWLEIDNERRERVRDERRRALEDKDWRDGEALRQAVTDLLAELPRFKQRRVQTVTEGDETIKIITLALNTNVDQLARAAKIASELQRLSTDEPTANIQLGGAALLTSLTKELDALAASAEVAIPEFSDDE